MATWPVVVSLMSAATLASQDVPLEFDWRNASVLTGIHTNYVTEVLSSTNPPGCDATWAFAAASMLGDRLSIASHASHTHVTKVAISPQVFVNCAPPHNKSGCVHGEIEWALKMAMTSGMVDATCMGYRAQQEVCDAVHVCVNCFGACNAVNEYVVYNVTSYSKIDLQDAAHHLLKEEIATAGPVACKIAADATLPSGDRAFHGSVVGYTRENQVIVNPNFGTFRGNDTFKHGAGFYQIPAGNLLECWTATPRVQGRGQIGGLKGPEGTRTEKKLVEQPRQIPILQPKDKLMQVQVGAELLNVPTQLDWRQRVELTPVRSHHVGPIYCGACYSMATTSTFSDVLKMKSYLSGDSVTPDVLIAAQAVIDCVNPYRGCFGNNAGNVFNYLKENGLPDESCDPFVSAGFHACAKDCLDCNVNTSTRDECQIVRGQKYFASYVKGPVTGESSMIEALQDGPIECMLEDNVPAFQNYKEGIVCNPGNETGHDHDVEIVGYGTLDGVDVWIGRNSWGTQWGMDGWFFLCRGRNNLGIESEGCYGVGAN